MSWLGIAAILVSVLYSAHAGNEWMKHGVYAAATPASGAVPAAVCPEDELEEEGLTGAECVQLASDVRSYLASTSDTFAATAMWLGALGTALGLLGIVAGAGLVNGHEWATRAALLTFGALAIIDAGWFALVSQAGPIIRGLYLTNSVFWLLLHLAFAMAAYAFRLQPDATIVRAVQPARAYSRFEVAGHWLLAVSVFFLFISSWWMLALPLPSEEMRYREFPFQLHKNLGITIIGFIVAMAALRLLRIRRNPDGSATALSMAAAAGHIGLYVLILAVCWSGYMSSSYSGWGTQLWWLIDLPYWGHEDEDLNQLYSDIHLWACWALLATVIAHIGAAMLHSFRNDGIARRIVRW